VARRVLRRAALLAAVALAVLAAGLAAARLGWGRREQAGLRERLREADELAGQGFLGKAQSVLQAAAASAAGEQDWLRLLKRSRAVAEATGDWGPFSALARRASGRLPGSEALSRLSLYGLLRAGASGPPQPPRGTDSSPGLQYLLAEAAVRGGRPAPVDLSPELESLLSARDSPGAETLEALAARWGEEGRERDAGLAWMAAGQTARAAAAFRRLPDGPLRRELLLGAAYDAGSWQEALSILEAEERPGPEQTLMRADLLLLLDREQEAAALYRQTIARHPELFWSPYLNLGGILAAAGQLPAAVELYRRAHELFPQSEEAATALLDGLARSGQREEAFRVLREALAAFPASMPLEWLLLEMQRADGGGPRYLAGLRGLYAENPGSAGLARTLAAHLLGLGDPAGAWAVLEEYRGPEEEPWLLEARGLVRALQGDLPAAEDLLRRCLEAGGDGRARCNLAVVLQAAGSTEAAAGELLRASGQLAGRPRLAGQARARLAELLLAQENRAAARREAAYALELDPGNGRALLLLRTLEAE